MGLERGGESSASRLIDSKMAGPILVILSGFM